MAKNRDTDPLWKRPVGRPLMFETPEALWEAACGYFQWVEDNPLWESKPFAYQGEVTIAEMPKMRAMTYEGLQLYLGISPQTWANYRERDEFVEIVTRVERVIREQKFTGAAAEMLNPNIIARDLGLKDGIDHSGEIRGGVLAVPIPIDGKAWAEQAREHQAALMDG